MVRQDGVAPPMFLSVVDLQSTPFATTVTDAYMAENWGVDPHTIPGTTSFQD